jgi:Zn-dependent peptidase ImmA (M78 family)
MARKIDVEKEAMALVRKYRVSKPPVPIEAIAEAEGALILRNHFSGYESGFALREGTSRIIGVNTATSPRRQRFTIAHELGHLILHDNPLITDYSVLVGMRDENSSLGTHRQEIDANGFAATLLMPQEIVVDEVRRELQLSNFSSKDEFIERLSRTFDVSTEAMGYRLLNLSIITA